MMVFQLGIRCHLGPRTLKTRKTSIGTWSVHLKSGLVYPNTTDVDAQNQFLDEPAKFQYPLQPTIGNLLKNKLKNVDEKNRKNRQLNLISRQI